jgi:hypothetical protein
VAITSFVDSVCPLYQAKERKSKMNADQELDEQSPATKRWQDAQMTLNEEAQWLDLVREAVEYERNLTGMKNKDKKRGSRRGCGSEYSNYSAT